MVGLVLGGVGTGRGNLGGLGKGGSGVGNGCGPGVGNGGGVGAGIGLGTGFGNGGAGFGLGVGGAGTGTGVIPCPKLPATGKNTVEAAQMAMTKIRVYIRKTPIYVERDSFVRWSSKECAGISLNSGGGIQIPSNVIFRNEL